MKNLASKITANQVIVIVPLILCILALGAAYIVLTKPTKVPLVGPDNLIFYSNRSGVSDQFLWGRNTTPFSYGLGQDESEATDWYELTSPYSIADGLTIFPDGTAQVSRDWGVLSIIRPEVGEPMAFQNNGENDLHVDIWYGGANPADPQITRVRDRINDGPIQSLSMPINDWYSLGVGKINLFTDPHGKLRIEYESPTYLVQGIWVNP